MVQHVLTNKDQFPTNDVIFSHIGKSKIFWDSLFTHIHANYPDFEEQWRFYNDGKCWLFKMMRKSKTIFWLSVLGGSFKITFYFGDKAEQALMESAISKELKNQFKNGKRYNKIRGITLSINGKKDIDDVMSLIRVKISTR